jgi:hypothetical protein
VVDRDGVKRTDDAGAHSILDEPLIERALATGMETGV